MLHEFAFESRADFGARLVEDEADLVEEVAQDFWARLTYAAPPAAVGWLTGPGNLPVKSLLASAGSCRGRVRGNACRLGPTTRPTRPTLAGCSPRTTPRGRWRPPRGAPAATRRST